MSQRAAYMDAYPKSKEWKAKTVDEAACRLEASCKILARLAEIREKENDRISSEAAWTRQDALKELKGLISKANEEMENKGEMSGPNVSAIVNAVKELNTIYAVAEKTDGVGVLEDILSAVRGLSCD